MMDKDNNRFDRRQFLRGCTRGGLLTALLAEGQLQIVLDWYQQPRDLDSHLWFPVARSFHVYFANRGDRQGCPHAELDLDEEPAWVALVGER